ncbi:MAG: hypothetical protein ACLFNN_00465 [Candidatus Paceibacterota bacterium]
MSNKEPAVVVKKEKVVIPRTYDTYMAVIGNSAGVEMFRNVYADVDGEYTDITDNGDLSCAFFVSSVLKIFGLIKEIHITVNSTVKDMERNGWVDTDDPEPGDVVVWSEEHSNEEKHRHIGFFLGEDRAISNSKHKRHPIEHSLEMKDREVERFLRSDVLRQR